jgi:hypothetical protein
MYAHQRHTVLTHLTRVIGALAVLAAGADHLQQYTANQFSTVPTIGMLFLLNFIGATALGVGLLAPIPHRLQHIAPALRSLLALGGIGLAASSLAGLWISETSSLFGFTDHGYRPAIVAAIAAELVAIIVLGAYLALARVRVRTLLTHAAAR